MPRGRFRHREELPEKPNNIPLTSGVPAHQLVARHTEVAGKPNEGFSRCVVEVSPARAAAGARSPASSPHSGAADPTKPLQGIRRSSLRNRTSAPLWPSAKETPGAATTRVEKQREDVQQYGHQLSPANRRAPEPLPPGYQPAPIAAPAMPLPPLQQPALPVKPLPIASTGPFLSPSLAAGEPVVAAGQLGSHSGASPTFTGYNSTAVLSDLERMIARNTEMAMRSWLVV